MVRDLETTLRRSFRDLNLPMPAPTRKLTPAAPARAIRGGGEPQRARRRLVRSAAPPSAAGLTTDERKMPAVPALRLDELGKALPADDGSDYDTDSESEDEGVSLEGDGDGEAAAGTSAVE